MQCAQILCPCMVASEFITITQMHNRYDAGDFLKISLPLATSVVLLTTSVLEFPEGYRAAGAEQPALDSLRWALQYLVDCHIEPYAYVALIGDVDRDHGYWGPPEAQQVERPVETVRQGAPAADLLGAVAAALAAGSELFATRDAPFSSHLLATAIHLYEWARDSPGELVGSGVGC